MNRLRTVVAEAVDDALLVLGTETRNVIYQHTENCGQFGRDDIPEHLGGFNEVLKNLLGKKTKMTLDEMFTKRMYRKLDLPFDVRNDWTFATHVENAKKRLD